MLDKPYKFVRRWPIVVVAVAAIANAQENTTTDLGAETVTVTSKPTVHGEGQPSIAGWGLWATFAGVVTVGLVVDHISTARFNALGKAVRGAIYASAAWVGLALVFAIFLMALKGGEVGFVFLTGYLVEESLSVDNLVVIAMIFKTFRIKPHDQGPVLKWGILGAIVMRLVFVFAGVWLLEHLHCVIYAFGALLIWSAWKMYSEEEDGDDGSGMHDHVKGDSWMMKLLTFFMPYNAGSKAKTFVEYVDGRACATPMLAALVVVELSDLLFAVDSIPCILGLTHDLFLVFSSNMFAILGLRSLYLLLAEALDKVKNLKVGLAAVLAFVGTKMMLGSYFPLPQSCCLLVIFGILGVTVVTSMFGANTSHGKGIILPM